MCQGFKVSWSLGSSLGLACDGTVSLFFPERGVNAELTLPPPCFLCEHTQLMPTLGRTRHDDPVLRSHGELPSLSSDICRERPPPPSRCPSLTWSRLPSLPNSLNKVKENIPAWGCTWAICTPCDSHVTHTLPSTPARCLTDRHGADTFSCNGNVTMCHGAFSGLQ